MRYAFFAAPIVALVAAQSSESESSSSSVSSVPYTNMNTQFLTQTNSLGVVTGQPTLANGGLPVTTQPAVNTDVGTVATIPAGLPTGVTSFPIAVGNGTTPASYFTVSVGSSTTVVLGAVPTGVSVSGVSGTATASRSSGSGSSSSNDDSNSSDNPSSTNSDGSSPTESSDADTSSGAAVANNMVGASGAVLGLGALIAAML